MARRRGSERGELHRCSATDRGAPCTGPPPCKTQQIAELSPAPGPDKHAHPAYLRLVGRRRELCCEIHGPRLSRADFERDAGRSGPASAGHLHQPAAIKPSGGRRHPSPAGRAQALRQRPSLRPLLRSPPAPPATPTRPARPASTAPPRAGHPGRRRSRPRSRALALAAPFLAAPRAASSATGAGSPGPRSAHLDACPRTVAVPRTSTTPPPCSIAFAIRLPVTCASRSRSPHTVRASPDQDARSSNTVRGSGRAPGLHAVRHQLREVDRVRTGATLLAASAPRRGRRAQARRDRARGRSRGGGRA